MRPEEKSAYLEGRLLGLNELIKILKELVEREPQPESASIVRTIVEHISGEMDSIMSTLKEELPQKEAARIEKRVAEIAKAPEEKELAEHVSTAEDIMAAIMKAKKETAK